MRAEPTMPEARRRAVIVIDVQRGLCEGSCQTFDSAAVIDRINLVTARARAAGTLVVMVQHESPSGLLARGSRSWQLAPALVVATSDTVLAKTAADAFHRTELDSILKQNQVTELVIGGMQSDFCVDTTTRRALALGYPVVLVADGHTTLDNQTLSARQIIDHHNETLASISSFGPRVRLEAAQAMAFPS
ncbi:MAG: cysteine hydrolase family protein [Burkholderiaceae bacterium]